MLNEERLHEAVCAMPTRARAEAVLALKVLRNSARCPPGTAPRHRENRLMWTAGEVMEAWPALMISVRGADGEWSEERLPVDHEMALNALCLASRWGRET